jgi:DNA-binding beta-propeller fold protein YncE
VIKTLDLTPGTLTKVATGAGAVWVGRRQRPGTPIASLIRVDPSSGETTEQPFGQEGIGDIAVGGGFVWVANARRDRLSRVPTATNGVRRSVPVGFGPHYVAFGAGFAWVTNQGDNTVSRVAPSFDPRSSALVGASPAGLAVGGGVVWVANRLADEVVRLDPRTGKPVGRPVAVGANPYAVAAHGASAWVTNLGDSTVTRIDVT